MSSYTATIGTAADVVSGDHCDVTVIKNDADGQMGDETVFSAQTTVRTDDPLAVEKAEEEAERILAAQGWTLTGGWEIADNALYAPAEQS